MEVRKNVIDKDIITRRQRKGEIEINDCEKMILKVRIG